MTQPRPQPPQRPQLPQPIQRPRDIIERAATEGTDRDALVEELIALDYTFRIYAPDPSDGAIPGTWDDIKHAYFTDQITRDEYHRIETAVMGRLDTNQPTATSPVNDAASNSASDTATAVGDREVEAVPHEQTPPPPVPNQDPDRHGRPADR